MLSVSSLLAWATAEVGAGACWQPGEREGLVGGWNEEDEVGFLCFYLETSSYLEKLPKGL